MSDGEFVIRKDPNAHIWSRLGTASYEERHQKKTLGASDYKRRHLPPKGKGNGKRTRFKVYREDGTIDGIPRIPDSTRAVPYLARRT